MLANESYSLLSLSHSWSEMDAQLLTTDQGMSVPGTPLHHSLTRHLSELEKDKKKREDEDLYFWMQRQQVTTS